MKAVILAGGLGSRLSEETGLKPKPMVEIGTKPIILHIMETYAAHGVTDFVICAGYKANVIKDYFMNFGAHISDVEVNLKQNSVKYLTCNDLDWTIKIIDTGADTLTGGRLKRIKKYVENDAFFHMTYGDGVADIDITALTQFHKDHEKLATVTTVAPVGRFGAIKVTGGNNIVSDFSEKPAGDGALINGGYFVLKPAALDFIDGDTSIWEREPMERLVAKGELVARHHTGFWHPMDTLRDKNHLNALIESNNAPWVKNVQ